jgi:parallel beta-helix repeat protein
MKKTYVVLITLLVFVMMLESLKQVIATHQLQYKPHSPIQIRGNSDFTSENGVIRGNGTKEDPYIIEGLELMSDLDGIEIQGTDAYFIIRNCYIHDCKHFGISLKHVRNGKIEKNLILRNGRGINLIDISDCEIIENTIKWNRDVGVYLYQSSPKITLRDNKLLYNKYGFYIWEYGGSLNYNIDESNEVDGKPVYYYVGRAGLVIDEIDAGFIGLVECKDIIIKNVHVRKSRNGILISASINITVEKSSFVDNLYGITIGKSTEVHINKSIISNNGIGVLLYESERCIIAWNNISSNYNGIELEESIHNLIHHNNFIYNDQHAYDEKVSLNNQWNFTSEGNYWSDHTKPDNNGDGIVDVPYNIPMWIYEQGYWKYTKGDNYDYHPLANPIKIERMYNIPPIAKFSIPRDQCVIWPITFDASTSYDLNGVIVNYRWDFGDGKTAEGKVVHHSYWREGIYIVKLIVMDNHGAYDSHEVEIRVSSWLTIPWVIILLIMVTVFTPIFTYKKIMPRVMKKTPKGVYEMYLKRLEKLYLEEKVSKKVYEKLKKMYEEKKKESSKG